MKLLMIGATGRTGRVLLDYALEKGHDVVALVRSPEKITVSSGRLTLVSGTPERAEDVAKAMPGCQALLLALNNNRTSDLPWAKSVSPARLLETAARNSVAAMHTNGVRRIVILSAVGVGDSFQDAPGYLRFLVRRTNLSAAYADHDKVDAYIRTTDTDWTLVRAVTLSNRDKPKNLVVSYGNSPKAAMMISRKHVARFMIDSLEDTTYFGKAPVISEK